jgi:hypothetical protein
MLPVGLWEVCIHGLLVPRKKPGSRSARTNTSIRGKPSQLTNKHNATQQADKHNYLYLCNHAQCSFPINTSGTCTYHEQTPASSWSEFVLIFRDRSANYAQRIGSLHPDPSYHGDHLLMTVDLNRARKGVLIAVDAVKIFASSKESLCIR